MLHSAINHGGRPLVVHYLHGPRFSSADARQLEAMVDVGGSRIVFHEVSDARLEGLPVNRLFNPAVWYPIFLPELLPELNRILYLDVDTIVVDRLDPLWDQPLDGYYLAAVTNVFMEYHRYYAEELGIPLSDYFNSGVLLLNLSLMRESDFTQQLLGVVRARGPGLMWDDQDALNLTVGTRRVALHPRWNVMNSFTTRRQLAAETFGPVPLQEALTNPAVRHFEGPGQNKPWHLLHEPAGRALYRAHRVATPWPRLTPEGDTPANRAKLLWSETRRHGHALWRRVGHQGGR